MKKKFIHIIVLSCKTATRLIEKKLQVKLSLRETIQLTWHKSVCDACTLYEKQVIFLDQVLTKSPLETDREDILPAEELERIQHKIIDAIEK